jgi:type IV secretory pathway TrbD component
MPWSLLTIIYFSALAVGIAGWVFAYLAARRAARRDPEHAKMAWDDNGDPIL